MPLVTVILTTLNSGRYVARSVASCLNQTHRDIELLVVDGGSQDGTLDIIARFADPRIRVVHQPDNVGKLPGAINLGMAEARGDYITWTQDDCWYEPHAIATMVEYLESAPESGLVYADYWEVDEEGRPSRYQRVHPPEDILCDDVVRVCFLFRRAVYQAVGPQDTRYFPVHEPPWRIKVAKRFPIRPIHIPLMFYTVHSQSLTGRIGGWDLQRLFYAALRAEGCLSKRGYRTALARTDIHEAYAAYVLSGSYRVFWHRLCTAVWRSPGSVANRGLLKLAIRSLLPGREVYRRRLTARWHAEDLATQNALREQGRRAASLAASMLGASPDAHC